MDNIFEALRESHEIQRKLADGVWTQGGCTSWYLDSQGVNRTIWPGNSNGPHSVKATAWEMDRSRFIAGDPLPGDPLRDR